MDDIDVTLILHKNVKLDTAEGDSVDCSLHVMENENPYALIFMVSADDQQCRLDISKDLIADQLKGWLEGDQVEASCIAVPTKIEEEIMKYVKFGTPPKPVLLAHWLLSRCQLKQFPALSLSLENKYQKPPKIDMSRLSKTNEKDSHKHLDETRFSMNSVKTYTTIEPPNNSFERSMEQATVYATKKSLNDDTLMSKSRNKQYDSTTSTVYLAQEMMGESQALNSLKGKTSKNSTMPVENVKYLSNDHYRLSNQLETSRRNVEKSLDKRRMMMEVSKVRAKSLVEKFTKSRDMAKFAKRGNAWTKAAELEVENIRKIQESIEDDMVRQRSRGAHAVQRVMWTLAPNGLNLGGKSLPGPIIGRGPLPSEATTAQKDPRIEKTISHFYWDEAGRKHRKSHKNNEVESLVEKAMNTIRRLGASSSTSNYKLNLKHVFEEMDKSGDGYIELPEMIEGFRSLGINLDAHSIEALFNHFDPNGSGSVNYGEFVWAFYNKKHLLHKWKKVTDQLSPLQLLNKFHQADTNGDGTLSMREFKRFIKYMLKMDIPDSDIELLFEKFDSDNDGTLDLEEFTEFMEKEMHVSESKQLALKSYEGREKEKNEPPLQSIKKPVYRPSKRSSPKRVSNSNPNPPTYSESINEAISSHASGNKLHSTGSYDRLHHASHGKLNHTTPGKLQGNSTLSYHVRKQHHSNTDVHNDPPRFEHSDANTSESVLGPESESQEIPPTNSLLWINHILQKQAKLESKLGHVYY